MRAPVSMRPPILASPTFPAPTTRQRLPSSFTNIGKRLLIVFSPSFLALLCSCLNSTWHLPLGKIACYGFNERTGQEGPQISIAVTSKEAPQIFARRAIGKIPAQQPFDGFGNLSREAAKTHWPCDRLIHAKSSAQAEVI